MIEDLVPPPLPEMTTVEGILTDFLGYVKSEVQDYFTNQHGNGAKIWKTLYPSMNVILTTPNGWEIAQQQTMRAAALKSTLAAKPDNVLFVTEAEVRKTEF
jgi:hypothetical protein